MTEPTKNVDRNQESEVAIAARSTLEAAREAARNLDASSGSSASNPKSGRVSTRGGGLGHGGSVDSGDKIPLIMGALEKLASATDHMAQQLGERLEEVRTEFARDLKDARGHELQQALEERDRQWSSQWSDMRGELDGVRTEVQQISTNLDRLVTMLAQKTESIAERVQDSRDEVREEVQGIRRSLQEDLGEARTGILEAVQEQIDAIKAEVERNRTESAKGQRSVVNDLAEGIGLAQASLDKRFDQLEAALDTWREQAREQLDQWTKDQDERLANVEAESQKIGELGQRLDRNHQEMMDLFEQEKHRAEQVEQDRQRDQARRLNNSGVARYHSGDFQRARRLFEQAVELDRNFAEAFNNLGLCLTEIGEHDEATVAFEAAIELNPDLGASYNNLGYVLYLQENFEAAIEMYKEAIGREHDTSAAYTNLGNAYQKLRETEKAVDAWRQALEIDPTNERAQQYLDRFAGGADLATPSYSGGGRGA